MPRGRSSSGRSSGGGLFSRPSTSARPAATTTAAPPRAAPAPPPAARPAPASSAPNPAFSRPNTSTAARPAPQQTTTARPTPTAQTATKPQQQAPPQPTPQSSSGPGILGTIASTAVGSMIGNVVANSLFGGRSSSDAPAAAAGAAPAAAAAAAPAAAAAAAPVDGQAYDPFYAEFGQCAPNFRNFMQCAESNPDNIGACQWNFSVFQDCRRQLPTQPIAPSTATQPIEAAKITEETKTYLPQLSVSHSSTGDSTETVRSPKVGNNSPSRKAASPAAHSALNNKIIRLNIGGHHFQTTKTTLLSRGNNFFVPLVNGEFTPLTDENGEIFIDRNGAYFAPILDYLRHGTLIVPPGLKLEGIIEEAKFYSIDLTPGLCGEVKEGLYTSSSWILFIERDPDHPWIWGITGVEERSKQAFFQEVCTVKDGVIYWRDNNIYADNGKVYIWNKNVFKSKMQLFYRSPRSERFPLSMSDILESDRTIDGEPVCLTFIMGAQGLQVKSTHSSRTFISRAIVLCKNLLIMQIERDKDRPESKESSWLLYLHSDLACFTFNHPQLEFGDSFHLQRGHSSS